MRTLTSLSDDFRDLYKFRDLTWLLAKRELTSRYKRSAIGVFWTLLNPAIATLVYSMVFSSILKFPVEDFIVYFLSGYLVWNFFAQATSAASNCVLGCAPLFRKHYVPKAVFVMATTVSAVIHFGVSMPPLLVLLLVLGKGMHKAMIFLPFLFLPALSFSLGLSFLLAAGTVFFADIKEMYGAILPMWFFLTPIVYPLEILPSSFLPLVKLNPMFYIILCFQEPVYLGRVPDASTIGLAFAIALVTVVLGYSIFSRLSDRFIYYV